MQYIGITYAAYGEPIATGKTTTLTFRIEPTLKEGLRAADREHRSIANMIEVLIRNYCGRNAITIQEQRALFAENHKTANSDKKK